MAAKQSSLASKILAVFVKDIKSEIRTRYTIGAIVMFAVVTVIAIGFSTSGIRLDIDMQGIVLWLAIYFASVAALGQSFIKEEQNRTSLALRVYASPMMVFAGKYLFNLSLLTFLVIIVVVLFAGLIGLDIENIGLFLAILVLSIIGLAGSTTIIAAIISRASIKGILFAVLSFPLILPLLIIAIKGTQKSLNSSIIFSNAMPEIQVLVSYAVVMTVAGGLLFEYVWGN